MKFFLYVIFLFSIDAHSRPLISKNITNDPELTQAITDAIYILERALERSEAFSKLELANNRVTYKELIDKLLPIREVLTLLKGGVFYNPEWKKNVYLTYVYDRSCTQYIGWTSHKDIGPDLSEATVTICSAQYSKKASDLVKAQIVLHETLHAAIGTGECLPILFESWVAYIATGTFNYSKWYWEDNFCHFKGYNELLPSLNKATFVNGEKVYIKDHD